MTVRSAELTFHITEAHSLKDKRMVARSLIDSARHKFNAAIAEVDNQDARQLLTIGVAVVSANAGHAQTMLENVLRYLEDRAEATLIQVDYPD